MQLPFTFLRRSWWRLKTFNPFPRPTKNLDFMRNFKLKLKIMSWRPPPSLLIKWSWSRPMMLEPRLQEYFWAKIFWGIKRSTTFDICPMCPMAEQGFPGGGGNPWGATTCYLANFPKKCMKMQKFWSRGGARVPRPPRSTNEVNTHTESFWDIQLNSAPCTVFSWLIFTLHLVRFSCSYWQLIREKCICGHVLF